MRRWSRRACWGVVGRPWGIWSWLVVELGVGVLHWVVRRVVVVVVADVGAAVVRHSVLWVAWAVAVVVVLVWAGKERMCSCAVLHRTFSSAALCSQGLSHSAARLLEYQVGGG